MINTILVGLAITLTTTSVGLNAATISSTYSSESIKVHRNPVDPVELMENILITSKRGILLDNSFYDDSNLESFFNAHEIKWSTNSSTGKFGSAQKLSWQLAKNQSSEKEKVSFVFTNQSEENNGSKSYKPEALLNITVGHDASYTAEVVESVFGLAFEIKDPNTHPYQKHPEPAFITQSTHNLGNKIITYKFLGVNFISTTSFVINGDGTVKSLSIIEKRK